MSVIFAVIGIIMFSFAVLCQVKVDRLNRAIEALHKKEIADLKSKLLLSVNTQLSELGESRVELSNKVEQLSALKKEQQNLDQRIIQIEVECEIEQIAPAENQKLLTKSP